MRTSVCKCAGDSLGVTCSFLLLKDRDLGLLLIIAVLGALIGLAALFGVLMYALR
jgi:hypothetical protein